MWDDDYDYDSGRYERPPSRYEVRQVYIIDEPTGPAIRAPRGSKFKFSSTEIQHLAIAYIVLVICFAVVFSTGIGGILLGFFSFSLFIFMLPVSFLAVGLGFILHEVAHKFAAQHYGCWSEFRYDGRGLMMALFFSLVIGFVYAAPGATWFSGHVTRRENGIISVAGPAVNMAISVIIIPLTFIVPLFSQAWWYLLYTGFIIAFLAVFNLLPVSPLDGSKVWQWNKGIFIFVFIMAIVILAFYYISLFTTIIF